MERWKPLCASHFSTPRLRLSTYRNSRATLTIKLIRKIGQTSSARQSQAATREATSTHTRKQRFGRDCATTT